VAAAIAAAAGSRQQRERAYTHALTPTPRPRSPPLSPSPAQARRFAVAENEDLRSSADTFDSASPSVTAHHLHPRCCAYRRCAHQHALLTVVPPLLSIGLIKSSPLPKNSRGENNGIFF
jgi:hypothetical protein